MDFKIINQKVFAQFIVGLITPNELKTITSVTGLKSSHTSTYFFYFIVYLKGTSDLHLAATYYACDCHCHCQYLSIYNIYYDVNVLYK